MTAADFADILVKIVQTSNLSRAERYELIGRFAESILKGSPGATTADHSPSLASIPSQREDKGEVVIAEGLTFVCSKCQNDAYTTNQPVYARMRTDEFRAAFTPELTKENGVWADERGNAAIDCHLCKGRKTVWIVGKEGTPYEDAPEGSDSGF